MCSSGSVLMCNGSILSIAELVGTDCDQDNAVHDHLLHKSPLQHPRYQSPAGYVEDK